MKCKKQGLISVISAYVAWGILPIFWALLADMPLLTTLYQRTVWSAVFLGVVLLLRHELLPVVRGLIDPKTLIATVVSATLLATNWLTYLWAIQAGELFTASMAYYICPLMTLAGAACFFKEQLTRLQLVSILTLAAGVSLPLFMNGELPWLALIIGGSWSAYILWRRSHPVSPLVGTFRETLLLTAAFSGWFFLRGELEIVVPATANFGTLFLFVVSGVVTSMPIVWLVKGMESTSLAAVGLLQYLAPTLTLACSVLYFHRPVSIIQGLALGFIWAGILVYFLPYLLRYLRGVIHPQLKVVA